jgi:hypothetical protein
MEKLLGFNRISEFATVEEFEQHLERLFTGGVYIFHDGSRKFPIFGRALVERLNGLRIEIYPREHAPPHFHVRANDIDAAFSIEDGSLLYGSIDRRAQDLIEYWFLKAKPRLIEVWNATRPSDCPVGPISAS